MNSFRREHINLLVDKNKDKLGGLVADFGGSKNKNSRTKLPSTTKINQIISINIDPNSNADYIEDLEKLSFKNENFDSFLLLEVLEHVKNPTKVIKEIYRVTKKNAIGFISMPFLYQVHMAPDDYRRWTKEKLRDFFNSNGFEIEQIIENGGILSVIFDLIRSHVLSLDNKRYINKLKFYIIKLLRPIIKLFVKESNLRNTNITTGYFLIIKKK